MQPQATLSQPADAQWQRSVIMERVILSVRQLWFGARELPLGRASVVAEPGGEMVMFLDGPPDEVDMVIAEAAERGAYVVATSLARPANLSERLRLAGFRPVLRQAAYVWDGEAAPAGLHPRPRRRWLLGLFGRRKAPPALCVRQIGPAELPSWNEVCWRAFGGRGSEADALREKAHAFESMGGKGRWYLASEGGRPAGTAILYQTPEAAQILAVGTNPWCRGRGVATAVIRRIIQDWQRDGHGFLFLDTTPGTPAEQLYLRMGFRQAYLREVYAPRVLDGGRCVR